MKSIETFIDLNALHIYIFTQYLLYGWVYREKLLFKKKRISFSFLYTFILITNESVYTFRYYTKVNNIQKNKKIKISNNIA